MSTILAIDLGTGGPKVALVGQEGEIVARTSRAVQTRMVPPNGAEQDPEEIWAATRDGVQEVLAAARPRAADVAAVICDAQFFSVVPVGADGRPTASLQLWLSQRGRPLAERILREAPEALFPWLEIHGIPPLGNDSLSHMLYLREKEPDAYRRTACFLEPVDYLNLRLTGVMAANACTAFPFLLTDNRPGAVTAYHPELMGYAGVDAVKLPPLRELDAEVGQLLPEVAEDLGLPVATPVLAGMNDTQAATLGNGAFRPGHGGLNVGTTMQVLAWAPAKKIDLETQLTTMPSPIPGEHMVLAEIGLGGKVLEHFLRELVFADDPLRPGSSADPFAGLEDAVAAEPPGSGGVLFLPFLTGAQAPQSRPAMRGAFVGLSLETRRATLLRAVLEGVALHMRWMVPAVEAFTGHTLDELTLSGGGGSSDGWAQIFADVLGRPVRQLLDARQVNTRGAAFLGFRRLGKASSSDIELFRPVKQIHEPRAAYRDTHDRLFERFVDAFDHVAAIAHEPTAKEEPADG